MPRWRTSWQGRRRRCRSNRWQSRSSGSRRAPFDLVYAAAAWHWTDPRTRWARLIELLAPGGVRQLGSVVAELRLGPGLRCAAVHSARTEGDHRAGARQLARQAGPAKSNCARDHRSIDGTRRPRHPHAIADVCEVQTMGNSPAMHETVASSAPSHDALVDAVLGASCALVASALSLQASTASRTCDRLVASGLLDGDSRFTLATTAAAAGQPCDRPLWAMSRTTARQPVPAVVA
jgi:hypothetical protein